MTPNTDLERPNAPPVTIPLRALTPKKSPTSPSEPRISASELADADSCDDGDYSELPPPLPFSKARCIAIVATTTTASFMNTFAIQSTVIILPIIGQELGIPATRLQWIVSAHSLAFGCFLLLWGRIADIYGKRFMFALGAAWVAVISAINPFLRNEIAFDLFRALHGLGAAANVPTAIGILGTTFPPGKAKNIAFTTYAAGAPLGSVFGNIVSGFMSQYVSWKWVFAVMAIVSGFIAVISLFVIPPPPLTLGSQPRQEPPFDPEDATRTAAETATAETTTKSKPRSLSKLASVDWIGGALITIGLLALLFALTEGNVVGWSTPWVPVLIVVSLAIIAAFAYWQHHLETKTDRPPLVRVSVFRNARFSAALVIMGLFFSSFNNFLVYATFFFQDYQGLSVLDTTLRFLPTGIVGILVAVIMAQLLSLVPTFYILLFGTACVSLASLLFAVPIPPTTSYFAYGLPAMCLSVMGADTTWPSLTLFTSQSLPAADQAMGGALVNAVGQVGRSIGLAISTTVQAAVMARERGVDIEDVGGVMAWDDASLLGLRAANWTTFALGVCSFVVVATAFRGNHIVGKVPKRTGGTAGSREEVERTEEVQDGTKAASGERK